MKGYLYQRRGKGKNAQTIEEFFIEANKLFKKRGLGSPLLIYTNKVHKEELSKIDVPCKIVYDDIRLMNYLWFIFEERQNE